MEKYSRITIAGALIGLIGIPTFMINFNDLSWNSNKEVYYGAIALVGLIGAIYFDNKSRKAKKELDESKNNK